MGSFSRVSSVAPVSFWTRSRKVWASAWTKVVGAVAAAAPTGDPTVDIGFDPTVEIELKGFSI